MQNKAYFGKTIILAKMVKIFPYATPCSKTLRTPAAKATEKNFRKVDF